jgi:hypothetical protein
VDALLLLRAPTRQVAPCMHQQCKHLQTAMATIAIASHRKQATTTKAAADSSSALERPREREKVHFGKLKKRR